MVHLTFAKPPSAGLSCAFGGQASGRLAVVKPSTPPLLAGPSRADNRLALEELDSAFGFELLSLYDGADGRSSALYPLPIWDYSSLRSRFKHAGNRLCELSQEDQLLCRVVFASAMPHWHSTALATPETRAVLARQLLAAAQENADMLGIWRKPDSVSTKSLLLLQQVAGRGEITSVDSLVCLSTCISHIKMLVDAAEPFGPAGVPVEGKTALIWSAGLFDAAIAVERRKEPYFSPSDYALIFSYPGKLAPRDLLVKALQEDAWSITVSALPGVRAYIDIARRVSMLLSRAKRMPRAEAEAAEYKSCWRDLDALYAWASMAAELAIHGGEGDEFGRTNLELYCNFAFGPAIAAEFAMLQHLEDLDKRDAAHVFDLSDYLSQSLLETARQRFPIRLCRYLRAVRTTQGHNFFAVLGGTVISVSRILAITRAFLTTSAWDTTLHDNPQDKLAALDYLATALEAISRTYPEAPDTAEVSEAVRAERLALTMLAGGSSLPPLYKSATAVPPSLGRLNGWTYASEVSALTPLLVHEINETLYDHVMPVSSNDSNMDVSEQSDSAIVKASPPWNDFELVSSGSDRASQRSVGPSPALQGPSLSLLSGSEWSTVSSEGFASTLWPSADCTFDSSFGAAQASTTSTTGEAGDSQALLDLLSRTASPDVHFTASPPANFLLSATATASPSTLKQANQADGSLLSLDSAPPPFALAAQNPYGASSTNGAGDFDWYEAAGDFGAT
ncbi:hypothetical protein NBRC10512v2_006780 [Rhodotorula toruloides]